MNYENNFNTKKLARNIGIRISVLRSIKGISRRKLAKKVGLQEKQLFQYEAGRKNISVEKLIRIAMVLELKIIHLIPNCKFKK